MKVRHLSGPKAGQSEHIENTVGRTLIALGVAVEEKLPPRSSAGWLTARNELANLPRTPDPHDVVPPNVEGVQWEAKPLPAGRVVILRKSAGEVARFEDLKDCPDCPANVALQFKELQASNNNFLAAEALEAAKRQQLEYDERVRHAKRW